MLFLGDDIFANDFLFIFSVTAPLSNSFSLLFELVTYSRSTLSFIDGEGDYYSYSCLEPAVSPTGMSKGMRWGLDKFSSESIALGDVSTSL